MEIPNVPEGIKPLDPKTITYVPQAGEIVVTRPKDALLMAGRARNFNFTEHEGGVVSAPTETNKDGSPRTIDYWDSEGRIFQTEFLGSVSVKDKTGPKAGRTSPKFSNRWDFDDKGRLISFKQVVTQHDGDEYLYRGDEYKYLEARPDIEYTLVHTDTEGQVEAKTFEERQRE